jgi:acyl-CoA synthetase (AMP-forming)/AMP-acid ligase II
LFANPDAADFWVGYIASHRAGAAAVPVNARYAARELAHVLRDSGAKMVLTAGEHRERASQLATAGAGAHVTSVAELSSADDSPFEVEIDETDVADLFYTSGTTGLPKGVVSTHGNSAHHGMAVVAGGGVFLSAIPLATFTGVQGTLMTPLRLGVTSVVTPVFDVHQFPALIESERAQWIVMVPAQIMLLLEAGTLEGRDVTSVMAVMFGGSPIPPAAVTRLGELLPGAVLLNGYGLTEGGGSVCVLPPGEAARRPGSVGRPVKGVDVRIDDADGRPVAVGDTGEVLLRVPTGERRYWNDEERTAEIFRDGWVRTGDLGRLDDDGFLYIVGRTKDVIIRGGYNITPVEVENALYEHRDIAEVAVLGVDHPVLGQDVCAVIRQRAGSDPLTLDDVRAFLGERVADDKRPRVLRHLDEPLPRTAAGKVDKAALREMIASSL